MRDQEVFFDVGCRLSTYQPKYSGPIRVAADPGGRHFIEGALDRRLEVSSLESANDPAIVVVRAVSEEMIQAVPDLLPATLITHLQERRGILVLDASGEGSAYSHAMASRAHQMLRQLAIDPAGVVYLTQNRAWPIPYRGFCYANQVTPMRVMFYDFFIRNFFSEHLTSGPLTFDARLQAFKRRQPTRERRFVNLNFTLRASKLLLLLQLLAEGLYDDGFISQPGFDKRKNPRASKRSAIILDMLTLPGLADVATELAPVTEILAQRPDALFGPIDAAAALDAALNPLAKDAELGHYNNSWFTIITETEMHGTQRITEKPFKPLANFSPFVLLGNEKSLERIRALGFRTFGGAFNETYDEETSVRERFLALAAEVRRLCALSDSQWRDIESRLAETLIFNAEHALTRMPNVYLAELEPQLIDALLALRSSGDIAISGT